MAIYREKINKEQLETLLNYCATVEVVIADGEAPVFVLHRIKCDEVIGLPEQVVIHKNNFIFNREVIGMEGKSKAIFDITPKSVTYPNKFRKKGSVKKFSKEEIFDKDAVSKEAGFLTSFRKLLKKHDLLESDQGRPTIDIESKDCILKEYEVAGSPGRFPIKRIREKLEQTFQERKNYYKLVVSESTIRRVINEYVKNN